jgi:hypothetical protein
MKSALGGLIALILGPFVLSAGLLLVLGVPVLIVVFFTDPVFEFIGIGNGLFRELVQLPLAFVVLGWLLYLPGWFRKLRGLA